MDAAMAEHTFRKGDEVAGNTSQGVSRADRSSAGGRRLD
jgi:hypothetical protein